MTTTTKTYTETYTACDICHKEEKGSMPTCHYCGNHFCRNAAYNGEHMSCGVSGDGEGDICMNCGDIPMLSKDLKALYAIYSEADTKMREMWMLHRDRAVLRCVHASAREWAEKKKAETKMLHDAVVENKE